MTALQGFESRNLTSSTRKIGRTDAGASWLGPTAITCRKVSLTAGDVVVSMGMYSRMTAENVSGWLGVALWDDDSTGTSQPGHLLGIANSTPTSDEFVFDANDERWFYVPLGVHVPSTGDYWMGFYIQDANNFQVAYDTTGGTAATLGSPGWFDEFGVTGHSFTSQTYDLSMHLVVQ